VSAVEHFEVAIIGGGVHGASAAYHLSRRGVRTVLFEKDHPAGGPTGRSSAVCRAYYTNPFLARVAREALDMLGRFADITDGGDAGYHRTGALFLHSPAEAGEVDRVVARLNDIGTKAEVLDLETMAARFPGFVLDDVALGVWETDAGRADPVGTTNGLYQSAVRHGLTSRLRTAIADIDTSGDAVVVTDTDGTRTSCDRLLIAAGPWTKPLAAKVGVDLPLIVERHWVVTCGWGDAAPLPFVFADIPGDYYATPEGSELFCLGPLGAEPEADPDAFDERVHAEEAARMLEPAARRVPAFAGADFRGGWASLYDVSPDWQPVIGEIAPGVFVDAGTSGHGFKLAPALGRHVADLVSGAAVDPGLAEFSPDRFAEGRLVAAGFGDTKILG
jgi:glycine/D-amino acid oxidase-like deaminating enzyme